MNLRDTKAAERLRLLITEGGTVAALERPSSVGPYIQDHVPLHSWLVRVENIVSATFGNDGPHYQRLREVIEGHVSRSYEVNTIVGILTGALDDLEGGFLVGQEHLIAGEIFDSVLEQARALVRAGYKDPGAVLARVVLEDTLRRIAREAKLPDDGKASVVNDSLRDAGHYPKPQWRLVQVWLDVGNSAAHGKFDEYTVEQVRDMLDGVERFLAQELR